MAKVSVNHQSINHIKYKLRRDILVAEILLKLPLNPNQSFILSANYTTI